MKRAVVVIDLIKMGRLKDGHSLVLKLRQSVEEVEIKLSDGAKGDGKIKSMLDDIMRRNSW